MHWSEARYHGEPACGRPRSIRGVPPLTEPATRSPPKVTIASRGLQEPDRPAPEADEGQPLAHPAGWSPDMVASPVGDAGLYLSDVPVYWPLPSPQGLRGPSNFPPPP
jgi:hypothetical protein